MALGALAMVLSLATPVPAHAEPDHGSYGPSGAVGIAVRHWVDPAPTKGRLYIELRNDRDETVGFRVTIWLNATEKQTRDVVLLATREVRQITIEGSAFERIVVEKVTTETQRRRSRASLAVIENVVAIGGGVTANFGWGTWVYPDAFAKTSGKKNPAFYFGVGQQGNIGAPLAGGAALVDGSVWELEIKIDSVGSPNYFDLKGLDGELVVEAPRPLYQNRLPNALFKVGVGGKIRIRCSVAPE